MYSIKKHTGNSDILFFILIFLLLFYDDSFLRRFNKGNFKSMAKKDPSILFFILIFLILFY
jgi:hypothetical protein